MPDPCLTPFHLFKAEPHSRAPSSFKKATKSGLRTTSDCSGVFPSLSLRSLISRPTSIKYFTVALARSRDARDYLANVLLAGRHAYLSSPGIATRANSAMRPIRFHGVRFGLQSRLRNDDQAG